MGLVPHRPAWLDVNASKLLQDRLESVTKYRQEIEAARDELKRQYEVAQAGYEEAMHQESYWKRIKETTEDWDG